MKRIALIIILLLLVAAGAAVFFLYSSLDSIAKAAIEKIGSEVTGTPVRVDKVKISPMNGEGSLRGFRVENPEGFHRSSAFQFDEISMKLDVATLTRDPVVIEEIVIQRPQIRYEIGARDTNVGRIQKNVESRTAGQTVPAKQQPAKGPKVLIRNLHFRDGQVTVAHSALLQKGISAPLPDLHLTNIGGAGGGGATPADLAVQIVKDLAASVTQTVGKLDLSALGQTVTETVTEGVKTLGDGARTIETQAGKTIESGTGAVREGAKDATDAARQVGRKLGDMFGRKK